MPRSSKVTPIVIDYQRDRHAAASRRQDDPRDEGPSGLFYLMVWTLSTGLFLLAFYVAVEAPFHPEGRLARRDPVAGQRPGLSMTSSPAPRASLGPLAGSRPVSPR